MASPLGSPDTATIKGQTAAYPCFGKCPYCNPGGLCTSTRQTRRLAPTVEEASQPRKVQVSLWFMGHHVVSLDMPPLCKWPEVVGVPIVSGDGQCSDVVTEVFGHLRGLPVSARLGWYLSKTCTCSENFQREAPIFYASLWRPANQLSSWVKLPHRLKS